MSFDLFYLLIGVLLVSVAMLASWVKRLPLSETMIYLAVGAALGPLGFGLLYIDPEARSEVLERLAEIAVIISLFTAGLKLRVPLRDRQWWIPIGLASASMVLTVGMVALVGMLGLGLPLGAAVLLGAILAPTDPVLAYGVQLENIRDRDRLRFSLTGEAGLNDGTALPFVMLGLGLSGLDGFGASGWKWLAIDVVWGVGAGLGIGALCGGLIGQAVIYLRREHHEGIGRDELLTLGLIAISYGAAVLVHGSGFLAVFAAGLALRGIERRHTGSQPPPEELAVEAALKPHEIATDPEKAPAHMAGAVLTINEQMERIVEVALVLVVAAALSPHYLRFEGAWITGILFFVIRPISVRVGLLGQNITAPERRLISWFGIRGIGSLYYLMFVLNRGVPDDDCHFHHRAWNHGNAAHELAQKASKNSSLVDCKSLRISRRGDLLRGSILCPLGRGVVTKFLQRDLKIQFRHPCRLALMKHEYDETTIQRRLERDQRQAQTELRKAH